ncbi:8647_t:CDS:2 [Dentiscutata erythropus]|uniref:8647_t:CDS:1 n=1 Tax=Dentiscutata erythropus TaxID=1348616 RepID=A0A9N9E6T8_9GLOM|nr:8647_t:CDS:2 [Dentiscutata erythropus]
MQPTPNSTQEESLPDDSSSGYYGVGENDLEQFLGFDEAEIKEVLSAVSMKPFHSAAFKKGIRELRHALSVNLNNPPPPPPLTTSNSFSIHSTYLAANPSLPLDVIINHAKIYGKNSDRQLTSYEQAINQAAIELALSDPALMANRGTLFEKAKAKLLLEGYTYKRGQSRSKLNPNAPKPGIKSSRVNLRLKRNLHAAQNSENRNARISELEHKLQIKGTQYEAAQEHKRIKTTQGDTEGLDKVEIALEAIERERAEISKELATLKSKERKHRWYEQRKKVRMVETGFDETTATSVMI